MGCPAESDSNNSEPTSGGGSTDTTPDVDQDPVPSGQSEPETSENGDAEANGDTDAEATGESSDVSLMELDWEGVKGLVESHQGKVVVVDLWSLGCEPCLIEFPKLVALSRQYPDQVACISVATDYQGLANRPLSHYHPKVLEFLQQQNAQFENVLCTTPKPEFFESLEVFSEPAIFVFNQNGEQAALFTGLQDDDTEVSYERHVVPFVESLLTTGG
jgi:thiol-disulfide isomerase/thioredoxin